MAFVFPLFLNWKGITGGGVSVSCVLLVSLSYVFKLALPDWQGKPESYIFVFKQSGVD